MRLTEKSVTETLRANGYKLTPQRRSVVKTIASSQDHLTPLAIYQKLRQDHPHIGLVTVYRTLEILARLELVCELHAVGKARSYTISTPEHHHHLICSDCGQVTNFAGYYLAELEQRLSRETGFDIEGHLLEFTGRCQKCQKNVQADTKRT